MRYCKLIMISQGNNNKFYEMTEKGSQIEVKYGRVESTSTTIYKPIGQWNSIVREKIKKGYKDITDLVSVKEEISNKTETTYSEIIDVYVRQFIKLMEDYTKNLVSSTYSIKPKDVTQKQVDVAQELISSLLKEQSQEETNKKLVELYAVIPRKMKDVKDHLLPNIDLEKHLIQEQDNLDAMKSQIKTFEPEKEEVDRERSKTILDKMGVEIEVCSNTSDIQYILDQIKGLPYRNVDRVYKVKKSSEDEKLSNWISKSKNKTTKFLIHGTRCSSVLPIIEQGLKIRPVGNFQFSGKAYGEGNYFSNQTEKSINYTGNTPDRIFLIYEVHYGEPFFYEGWYRGNSFPLNYDEISKRGFDCTHVKSGNGLRNDEIITYREEQCSLKYIIHIK